MRQATAQLATMLLAILKCCRRMRWAVALALVVILSAAAPQAFCDSLVVVAGGGTGGDGTPAAAAKVVMPFGVDFGADGRIYFVEMVGGERLRAIDRDGIVRTLAGTGEKGSSGDDGPGLKATFNGMHSLAVGPDGVVYLADTLNNRIRAYDPRTGLVSAFAGTGDKGHTGDGGPAGRARFGGVYCLAFDHARRNLYIADLDNRRIRKIDMKTGVVTNCAGNGKRGVPRDGGNAAESPLLDPRAVAVAPDNGVLILERSGHALRLTDPKLGTIFTVAGTGRAGSDLADGSARKVRFNGPKHLCVESHDQAYAVLIADTENHRVVRYTPGQSGTRQDAALIKLVAGTGKKGAAIVAGDPLKSELFQPHGVAVHPKTGEIYIADSGNNRILKIEK
jgi:DNA-binding beta-propeller fold protein YncE